MPHLFLGCIASLLHTPMSRFCAQTHKLHASAQCMRSALVAHIHNFTPALLVCGNRQNNFIRIIVYSGWFMAVMVV
jgi:hypothetical protein